MNDPVIPVPVKVVMKMTVTVAAGLRNICALIKGTVLNAERRSLLESL
jgi:hypothetical protein